MTDEIYDKPNMSLSLDNVVKVIAHPLSMQ